MAIETVGLKKIENKFRKFNMSGPNIKSRFLDVIGVESLQLLRINTPRDTGQLAD